MAKPLPQLAGLHEVEISKALLTMNVNEIDPKKFCKEVLYVFPKCIFATSLFFIMV